MNTRRAVLALLAKRESVAPIDERSINAFIAQMNAYIESLNAGTLDARQWPRVVRAWERLR